nr:MAG TPA: hypothetical protein [Caudoviricetes sp.]
MAFNLCIVIRCRNKQPWQAPRLGGEPPKIECSRWPLTAGVARGL